ncbi:MAG TPA: hypothetical protein VGM46_03365 [Mesorhizobium sp.]|jgi:hypothetical protein
MASRRNYRMASALMPLCLAAACASQPAAPSLAPTVSVPAPAPEISSQASTLTYNCADGGMMTIQNLGTSIRLLGPSGIDRELPASPPDQRSRYGKAHDAIIIDGRDALVVKGGQTPLACSQ